MKKQKVLLNYTEKFHKIMENKKKITEQKISQMKDMALNDIKNSSIRIGIETAKHLIKNSIDKSKLEKFYIKSIDQTKSALKNIKT